MASWHIDDNKYNDYLFGNFRSVSMPAHMCVVRSLCGLTSIFLFSEEFKGFHRRRIKDAQNNFDYVRKRRNFCLIPSWKFLNEISQISSILTIIHINDVPLFGKISCHSWNSSLTVKENSQPQKRNDRLVINNSFLRLD